MREREGRQGLPLGSTQTRTPTFETNPREDGLGPENAPHPTRRRAAAAAVVAPAADGALVAGSPRRPLASAIEPDGPNAVPLTTVRPPGVPVGVPLGDDTALTGAGDEALAAFADADVEDDDPVEGRAAGSLRRTSPGSDVSTYPARDDPRPAPPAVTPNPGPNAPDVRVDVGRRTLVALVDAADVPAAPS